jgi:hypothetical protein
MHRRQVQDVPSVENPHRPQLRESQVLVVHKWSPAAKIKSAHREALPSARLCSEKLMSADLNWSVFPWLACAHYACVRRAKLARQMFKSPRGSTSVPEQPDIHPTHHHGHSEKRTDYGRTQKKQADYACPY